jgi:biopolymer transport protein TolR
MSTQDAPLSASQRSKIRRLSVAVEPAPGEEAGELNIVPYLDIITNILVFVLATISVVFLTNVDTTNPSQNSGQTRKNQPESKALNLVVLVVKDNNVAMKTAGGSVAAGCANGEPHAATTTGQGLTVPSMACRGPKFKGDPDDTCVGRTDGAPIVDRATLKKCARNLKALSPDYEDEVQVTIAANPGTEFRDLLDVIDALRNDDAGELFPDIHFGVPK